MSHLSIKRDWIFSLVNIIQQIYIIELCNDVFSETADLKTKTLFFFNFQFCNYPLTANELNFMEILLPMVGEWNHKLILSIDCTGTVFNWSIYHYKHRYWCNLKTSRTKLNRIRLNHWALNQKSGQIFDYVRPNLNR